MNNPFGLINLWMAGDAVTRFVAVLLLVSSIITWVILISRLWNIKTLRALKPEAEQFWRASSFAQGLAGFSDQANNPYFRIAKEAMSASEHHQSQSSSRRELLQTLN